MNTHILVAVSEHGFWAEELLEPLRHFQAAGFEVDFIVNKGSQLPFPDAASLDATYVDPPLGRVVTTPEMAESAKSMDFAQLFANRHVLTNILPIRPYLSADNYLTALEEYYYNRSEAWKFFEKYAALLLVGGSGPVIDMVNNPRLHDLILGFYYSNKPIAAECYAVTCLAFAREVDNRICILDGKHVTGHTIEYDYTENWAVQPNQREAVIFDAPPYPLEYILRNSVGPQGQFHGNVGRPLSVIVDYPFITSRSVGESSLCGEMLVRVLKDQVHRYGW